MGNTSASFRQRSSTASWRLVRPEVLDSRRYRGQFCACCLKSVSLHPSAVPGMLRAKSESRSIMLLPLGLSASIDQVQIHLSTAHQCSSGSETGTHNVGSSKNCDGSVTLALVNTPCDASGSNTATVASKKNARLLEYICLIANIHSGTLWRQ